MTADMGAPLTGKGGKGTTGEAGQRKAGQGGKGKKGGRGRSAKGKDSQGQGRTGSTRKGSSGCCSSSSCCSFGRSAAGRRQEERCHCLATTATAATAAASQSFQGTSCYRHPAEIQHCACVYPVYQHISAHHLWSPFPRIFLQIDRFRRCSQHPPLYVEQCNAIERSSTCHARSTGRSRLTEWPTESSNASITANAAITSSSASHDASHVLTNRSCASHAQYAAIIRQWQYAAQRRKCETKRVQSSCNASQGSAQSGCTKSFPSASSRVWSAQA